MRLSFKRLFVVLSLYIFQSLTLHTQTYLYKKLNSGFDDIPQCSASTPDSGIVIGGYTKLSAQDWALYVSKLDKNGVIQWTYQLKGSGKDLLHDIEITSDDGFILSGRTWSYLTMGGDAFISKIDNNGNHIFTTVVDGYKSWYNAGLAVDELSNGDFIQIGKHHIHYNPVRYDWEVNHFSSNGTHLNSYVIGKVNGDDGGIDIHSLDSNEYIAGGYTETITTGEDMSFMHSDINGNILYFASYTGSGDERINRIIENSDGSFFLSGLTNSYGAGNNDFIVLKIDSNWNVLWQKTYGGPGEDQLITASSDGHMGLVMGGFTDGFGAQGNDNLIIRIDSGGNLIKAIAFGGNYDESIESITLDSFGSLVFQTKSNSYTGGVSNDIILLKTDILLSPECEFSEAAIQVNNSALNIVLNATKLNGVLNNVNVNLSNTNISFTENNLLPVIDAGTNQVVCANDSALFHATGINIDSVSWNNGLTDSIVFYPSLDSQMYIVSGFGNYCVVYDSAYIKVVDPISNPIESKDTSIYYGSSITISTKNGVNYIWHNSLGLDCENCQYPIATPLTPTQYKLIMRDSNNCLVLDSIFIDIIYNSGVFLPNAFSPNGDGINDVFKTRTFGLKKYEIIIFNRWGNTIYNSHDINESWDGKHKGKHLDCDVFIYKIIATYNDGSQKVFKGNITLIN